MLRENKAMYKGNVWYDVSYIKLWQNLIYHQWLPLAWSGGTEQECYE